MELQSLSVHVNAIPSMIVCVCVCVCRIEMLHSLNSTLRYYLGPGQAAANGGSAQGQPQVTGNMPCIAPCAACPIV